MLEKGVLAPMHLRGTGLECVPESDWRCKDKMGPSDCGRRKATEKPVIDWVASRVPLRVPQGEALM